jgi:hypothetical protein
MLENHMTFLFDDKIRFDDSENLQAFGRLKTADARILGDYRFMYGGGTTFEVDYVTSNGATMSVNYTSVSVVMNIATTSGSMAILQTKQYHPYIPGTGHSAMMTFVMTTGVTSVTQSAGLFDADNGVFFRIRNTVPEFVIRNRGVDVEVVAQSAWNVDRLDGSMTEYNQSGFTADWTKAQILAIDFQWLGVGRARLGFVIDGNLIVCHHFEHANRTAAVPYMSQPSLPLRWEIKNTATLASTYTMTSICGSVFAEGADFETGFIRAVSTNGLSVNVTSANSVVGRGILAVRLKNNEPISGKAMRALARLKRYSVATDADMQFKVVILPGIAAISSTVSWTSVPGLGWCEYTRDFALTSTWTTNSMIIDDQFAVGSTNNKLGVSVSEPSENRNSVIFQNHTATDSQILAIVGFYLNANVNAHAGLKWIEVK